jgi:hypothetical protein
MTLNKKKVFQAKELRRLYLNFILFQSHKTRYKFFFLFRQNKSKQSKKTGSNNATTIHFSV